ncbi:ATP-binding protein [bacterium]|nr:ATP-binding protein [bacterium]
MKEIVVISGKGGTGKTSITAAFATLAKNIVVADCDVDAADLHLVLSPQIERTEDFTGGKCARIEPGLCMGCGKCESICRFEAVSLNGPANDLIAKTYLIDPTECEGCGVCAKFCPTDAIVMEDDVSGQWFVSRTHVGPMVHAKLKAGGENSGKLVTLIRNESRSIAESVGADIVLTDGPPGTGCPVIASLTGASMAVIVTEPTMSGVHDLKRVAELVEYFKIPASLIINKCDINSDKSDEIAGFAESHNIEMLGRLPYDPDVTKAQIAGMSITQYSDNNISRLIRDIWGQLEHKE